MTNKEKVWKKEEIKEVLMNNDRFLKRGIVGIYLLQEADEQQLEQTTKRNNVGFNSADAKFLTSLAKRIMEGKELTEGQRKYGRKAMIKYVGQLVKIANKKIEVNIPNRI